MAQVGTQSLVTAQGKGLPAAVDALRLALERYGDARIVSMVQQTSYMYSLRGQTVIVAVVDHD